MILQWCHLVAVIKPSFWRLHCDVIMIFVMWQVLKGMTMKTSGDLSQSKMLVLTPQSSLQMSVTWESLYHFIIIPFDVSTQFSSLSGFTLESLNKGHIKFTWWLHCNVTWRLATKQKSWRWVSDGVIKWRPLKNNNGTNERYPISIRHSKYDTLWSLWSQNETTSTGSKFRVVYICYTCHLCPFF